MASARSFWAVVGDGGAVGAGGGAAIARFASLGEAVFPESRSTLPNSVSMNVRRLTVPVKRPAENR
jgi:hypothetical protein